MDKRTPAVILLVTLGCRADLSKVHTPDLLAVSEQQQRKWVGLKHPRGASLDLPSPTAWQVHSSLTPRLHLHDDDETTYAVAADPASKDQYVLIDLGCMATIHQVTQTHVESGCPLRYRIDVAGGHNFPYSLRFVGEGTPGMSVANLRKPVQARFLRITLLECGSHPWTVGEIAIR